MTVKDITLQKLQAGRLFYQWGIVIGRKLEEIMNEDRQSFDPTNSSSSFKRQHVNYLYQGKKLTQNFSSKLFIIFSRKVYYLDVGMFYPESYIF